MTKKELKEIKVYSKKVDRQRERKREAGIQRERVRPRERERGRESGRGRGREGGREREWTINRLEERHGQWKRLIGMQRWNGQRL